MALFVRYLNMLSYPGFAASGDLSSSKVSLDLVELSTKGSMIDKVIQGGGPSSRRMGTMHR